MRSYFWMAITGVMSMSMGMALAVSGFAPDAPAGIKPVVSEPSTLALLGAGCGAAAVVGAVSYLRHRVQLK